MHKEREREERRGRDGKSKDDVGLLHVTGHSMYVGCKSNPAPANGGKEPIAGAEIGYVYWEEGAKKV